jgi:NO-binding membrane sensor protein with MHYT domain
MTVGREVLVLVGLVVAVDAVFVALYFLTRIEGASDAAKAGFTVAWTIVTLGVVLRGLTRIRRTRLTRVDRR